MQYSGLNEAQVEAARRQGENRLNIGAKTSVAGLFFSQFKDVMILILAAATVVSAWMGDGAEAATIIAIVLLNALMGFLQEYKTEKTLHALQAMTAPTAHVVRSGRQQTLPAAELVCGDIAMLHAGDRVPADGVLLEAQRLSMDESLLTGESTAVEKQAKDGVFMGAMTAAGAGVMRVTAVGMATEMGRIASMIGHAQPEKTPLQKRLQQLGKTVAVGCLLVCVGVGLLGWVRGEPFWDMLLAGISLAVAAIPEGMPAIVTIVLALSVGRILKKGAIIRRLPAVETLGCAGVICSDKTGTITQNRMALQEICCGMTETGSSSFCLRAEGLYKGTQRCTVQTEPLLARLLRCAVLCSQAQAVQENGQPAFEGDATETALLAAVLKAGESPAALHRQWRSTKQIPFDSVRKRMCVTVAPPTGQALFLCKGAPDVLLEHCSRIAQANGDQPLGAVVRRRLFEKLGQLASQGYRVLAFAENDRAAEGEHGMIFLGLAALQDPPKPQVEGAVRRCRHAGMKPVMITGDYPQTAQAIAARVGIWRSGDVILTGSQLDGLSDSQLEAVCMKTSVYARVTPQHKLRIVRAYQNCGQVVAMTGDAVLSGSATAKGQKGLLRRHPAVWQAARKNKTAVLQSAFRRKASVF